MRSGRKPCGIIAVDMAEARREEKSFIAVNMLRMGMDISLIAKATGLSEEAVELLKKKLP